MGYIMFYLEEMEECGVRSSSTTLEQDLRCTTSDPSHPLLKYALSNGFDHLSYLGSGNACILKDMYTLQMVISRCSWEWDRLCKLVPLTRSGIAWPSSRHDFTMYTLLAFASDALFHAFLDRSVPIPKEETNPLVYAAHLGKIDHARTLILRGADVNGRGLLVDNLSDIDANISDADDLDLDALNLDSPDKRHGLPIEVAVDHWHAEMLDLLLAQGSTVPDELLARVLKDRPDQFPLYIIRRLLQMAGILEWATVPWDNRRLLEALVEDGEDYEQTACGDDLILAIQKLVQAGCGETLLLVAVEKACILVVNALLSTSVSGAPGGSSIRMQKDELLRRHRYFGCDCDERGYTTARSHEAV